MPAMNYSEAYYQTYKNLPEKLAEFYTDLQFDNHCYLRIALDNTTGGKWDTIIKRPAYKNLTEINREKVLKLLECYFHDKTLLLQHNQISLRYRNKT